MEDALESLGTDEDRPSDAVLVLQVRLQLVSMREAQATRGPRDQHPLTRYYLCKQRQREVGVLI